MLAMLIESRMLNDPPARTRTHAGTGRALVANSPTMVRQLCQAVTRLPTNRKVVSSVLECFWGLTFSSKGRETLGTVEQVAASLPLVRLLPTARVCDAVTPFGGSKDRLSSFRWPLPLSTSHTHTRARMHRRLRQRFPETLPLPTTPRQ